MYTYCIPHFTKNFSPPLILLVAPTMNGLAYLFPQTFYLLKTLEMGGESCLISYTGKIILTKQQFSCNHPIQASFKAVVTAVVSFFLTLGFIYRYIMLILINRWLVNLIWSMIKAMNSQNSFKQNYQPLLHLSMLFVKRCFSLFSSLLLLFFISNLKNFF